MQITSEIQVLKKSIHSLKEAVNTEKSLPDRPVADKKDAGQTKQWRRTIVQAGKTIFYHLGSLLKSIKGSNEAEIRGLGQSCLDCLVAIFSVKTVELTPPYQEMVVQCITLLFLRSETLNLRSAVMDLQQILEKNRNATGSRICAALCLGSLCEVLGHRMQSTLKDTVDALHRAAKSSEKGLREGCMSGIKGILSGCGDGGLFMDFFRILQKALQDRLSTPIARSNALGCLPLLLGHTTTTFQPDHQSLLLQLCCRGLEDEVMMVRLAAGQAMGTLLRQSIAQGERQRAERSVRAARGEDQPQAQGSDGEGGQSSGSSGPQQGFDKALTKLKELNVNLKLDAHHKGKQHAAPFTLKGAMDYLCSLMWRNSTEEWRAACATAFVTLLETQQDKFTSDNVSWLVPTLLDLLVDDKMAQVQDPTALRVAVSHILRDGVCVEGSEQIHLTLATQLVEYLTKQDRNEHQTQVALGEVGHLISSLGEACAVFMESLSECLRKLIGSPKYGVRFEAAHVMASLALARPEATALLLSQMLAEVEMQSAALIALGKGSSDARDEDQRKEKTLEMRTRMYSLHGGATCSSLLLKSIATARNSQESDNSSSLVLGLPQQLLAHAASLAERLVTLQFAEGVGLSAGIICTNVRAGWSLVSSLIAHGPSWVEQYMDRILQWWKQVVQSCRQGSNRPGFESTHQLVCLDAALASMLCFLKTAQPLIGMVEGLLGEIVELLGGAFLALKYNLEAPSAPQGAFRHNLIKAELMECYAWLPPGSFAEISDEMFDWAMEHIRTLVTEGTVSTLLHALLNPADEILQASSPFAPPSLAPGSSLAGGLLTDQIIATEVQLMGMSLGHLERDAMVCAGLLSEWCDQGHHLGTNLTSPTSLHGANWCRPPPPPTYMQARLLDAAINAFSATFGYQSAESQLAAVGMLISLLPSSMRPGAKEKPNIKDVMASEEEKRKREHRLLQSAHNVVTATLALLCHLPSYRNQTSEEDSVLTVDMPWAAKVREMLLGLIGINSACIRQAAAAGLGEMGLKLGSGFTANLTQLLLGRLSTHQAGPKKTAPLDIKGEVKAAAVEAAGRKLATVLFSFACLRRSNGNDIELTWIWGEFHRHLTASDLAPNATAWGMYSLAVLLGTIQDPNKIEEKELKQMLTSVMELVELHYFGPGYEIQNPVILQAILKLISSTFPLLACVPSLGAPAFRRFASISNVLSAHWDLRVRIEALRLLEAACAHCSDLVQEEEVGLIPAVARALKEKGSPDCLATALQVLATASARSLDVIISHKRILCIEVFRILERLVSSTFWKHAPFWRAVNIGRPSLRFYHQKAQLQIQAEDLLQKLCGSSSELNDATQESNEVDWLLMARAFFLVTGSKKNGPMDLTTKTEQTEQQTDTPQQSGEQENEDEEKEEAAPDAEDHVSDWRSYLVFKRKMVNQEVSQRMGGLRWQTKAFAVFLANTALSQMDGNSTDFDIIKARQSVNEKIMDSHNSKSLFDAIPDNICLYLEDLIAVTSAATGACVGDFDLPSLQKEGAQLLGYIFQRFGTIKDPEIVSEDEGGNGILEPTMSQLNISLRASLSAEDRPLLILLVCKPLVAAIKAKLIRDGVVVRRLLKLVVPDEWNSLEAEAELSLESARPSPSLVYERQLVVAERISRLAALGEIYLEAQQPGCPPGVIEGVAQTLVPVLKPLVLGWTALVHDVIRVNQGEKFWPSANKSKQAGFLIDEEVTGYESKSVINTHVLPCLTALSCCLSSERSHSEKMKEDFRLLFLVCHTLLLEYTYDHSCGEGNGLMVLTATSYLTRSPWMTESTIPVSMMSDFLRVLGDLSRKGNSTSQKAVELLQQMLRQDGAVQKLLLQEESKGRQQLWGSVVGVFTVLLDAEAPVLLEEPSQEAKVALVDVVKSPSLVRILLVGALMIPLDPEKEHGAFCHALLLICIQLLRVAMESKDILNLHRALAVIFQEASKLPHSFSPLAPVMDAVTEILANTLKTLSIKDEDPRILILIQIWSTLLCCFEQFTVAWFQPLKDGMLESSKESQKMLFGALNQSVQACASKNGKVAQSIMCYTCPTSLISLTRSVKELQLNNQSQISQLIAENLKLILLSYKLAEASLQGKIVELILPEFVQVIKLQDPLLVSLTGQSLLHIARESPVAFKTTVQAVNDADRQVLQKCLQDTMQGVSNSTAQKTIETSKKRTQKKIDLSMYKKS